MPMSTTHALREKRRAAARPCGHPLLGFGSVWKKKVDGTAVKDLDAALSGSVSNKQVGNAIFVDVTGGQRQRLTRFAYANRFPAAPSISQSQLGAFPQTNAASGSPDINKGRCLGTGVMRGLVARTCFSPS